MTKFYDFKSARVGDTFYRLTGSNNALRRNRITKVIDGKEWFSYDMPLRSFSIIEYKICGIVWKVFDGDQQKYSKAMEDGILEPVFYVESNGNVEEFYPDVHYGWNYRTYEDAAIQMAEETEEAKEIDRK